MPPASTPLCVVKKLIYVYARLIDEDTKVIFLIWKFVLAPKLISAEWHSRFCTSAARTSVPHHQSSLTLSIIHFCHIVIMDLMKLFPFSPQRASASLPFRGASVRLQKKYLFKFKDLSRLRDCLHLSHDKFLWKLIKSYCLLAMMNV